MTTLGIRPTVVRIGALSLAMALALGACGGETDKSNGASSTPAESDAVTDSEPADEALDTEIPDLCSLFTAEDFESVTGEAAGEPEVQEELGAIRGSCTTSAKSGFPLVMVAAYNEADREATLSIVDAQPVDDLGVEAYWDDSIGLVIPMEGKDWYLQVIATDGGANLGRSTQAAEIVLSRL